MISVKSARISSRMHIEDLADRLQIEIEESEEVDTIGGYMAKELGRVPIPGSRVEISGWSFTAERPQGRRHRISSILAERIDGEGAGKPAENGSGA